jgi:PAS domain S-box-containing protein
MATEAAGRSHSDPPAGNRTTNGRRSQGDHEPDGAGSGGRAPLAGRRLADAELELKLAERSRALAWERERVSYLLRLTTDLAATLDQDRVLVRALELINEVVHATQGAILLLDNETGNLILPDSIKGRRAVTLPGFRYDPAVEGAWLHALIRDLRPVIVDDLLGQGHCLVSLEGAPLRSMLAMPLVANDEIIGVMVLLHREPAAFSRQQLELVEAAAIQVASALSNTRLFLLIRDQAEWLGAMLREEQVQAARSQAILESIADGVLVADGQGKVTLANLAACQILDRPRHELVGQNIGQLPLRQGIQDEAWRRLLEQRPGRVGADAARPSLVGRFQVGSRIVSLHLSAVVAGGQLLGGVTVLRDVTQEVEVDRMKSEFVSTVSHELRTPMTSIKGYAELMLAGMTGEMSAPHLRYLRVIKNNADRMTGLINDLLDISRIESGRIRLELEPVDVAQLASQVVEGHLRARLQNEGKAIDFRLEMEPDLPTLRADRARLAQVLTNLVDNAFQYSPAVGCIVVRGQRLDGELCLSVEDKGLGIGPEDLQHIFERFYRAQDDAVQRVPGTGLGLSIVRSLVELHGGRIEVESRRGRGSTFRVYLPLAAEAPPGTVVDQETG